MVFVEMSNDEAAIVALMMKGKIYITHIKLSLICICSNVFMNSPWT